jgi:hypothetical protein
MKTTQLFVEKHIENLFEVFLEDKKGCTFETHHKFLS